MTTSLRMFDSNTFQWKDVPIESVKNVLLTKSAKIANLSLDTNRKVVARNLNSRNTMNYSMDSGGCSIPFLEIIDNNLVLRENSIVNVGIEITYLNAKYGLYVLADGTYRVWARGARRLKEVELVLPEGMDYESPIICKIREELKSGSVVEKVEMKAAVIGVTCNVINDGKNVVYVGNCDYHTTASNENINVPNGVTKIASGAIKTRGKVVLPKTVKEIERYAIEASSIELPDGIMKANRAINVTGNTDYILMPKFSNDADVTSLIYATACPNVMYPDYGEKHKYEDKALAGISGVENVDIMNSGDIIIGRQQFQQSISLKKVITPNGKITAIGSYAFASTPIQSIDLSGCKLIESYAFRLPQHCEVEKYPYYYIDTKRPYLNVTFKENIKINTMALYGSYIARIDFLCDDIELSKNSLYCGSRGIMVRYTSEKVGRWLEYYRKANPFHIISIEKIG